jgi:hemoglobin-like flavoprotein
MSNWFKKDERISGKPYEVLKPRGPQVKDEQLQKLNAVLASAKTLGRTDIIAPVEAKIAQRKAELQAAKAKKNVMSEDELAATLAELGL